MENLMFSAKGFYHDNSVSEFWVYDREKHINAVRIARPLLSHNIMFTSL